MEPLSVLLHVLAYWRVAVSLAAFSLLALVLHTAFPSLPTGGLALVTATGVAIGALWQGKAEAGLGFTEKTEPIVLSRPVECLALWFFGAVYGGIWAGTLDSRILASVAIVISVIAVAVWHSCRSRQRAPGYYVYAAVAMLTGFGSLLLFTHNANSSF